VWGVLEPALVNTMILLVPALIVTAVINTLFGFYVGWNRGSLTEKAAIVVTTTFRSTPIFLTGIVLLLIFAYQLEMFPLYGMRSLRANPEGFIETYVSVDFLRHYFLPFMTAVMYYSGDFLLLSSNGVVEKKGSEFLKLHEAKGLTSTQRMLRAGRNSLLPVITYFALRLGMLFQGLILLEVVFAWPGIGRVLVQAIVDKDYPVVQGAVFIMALAVIVMNLIADVTYAYLDPTVSGGGQS
jgi:peptide/nickel transport system permease protein